MNRISRNILILLGGLAGPLAAGAATPASGVPSVALKYSAQSLESDTGVNELYRRIVRAAEQVCPASSIHDLSAMQREKACRREAVARAIQQVNNARLAALYAARAKSG